ncbi:formylglycine-generating enzyme family protein [Cronobacter turicensis]|uniref:formylglycine-generating enzyme family protein n=1 Tax=Cronobacter turicensis TaxID=413502 RepID=UPI0024C43750|nr:SUMF1/EgtB/PvdO family nonheme iron enzyme [Cronobacter turicensis]MDK1234758.1 SUMF1/EgtB/PvdO family nonheme iron enzyme [Cronobacter turicensis]
MYVKGGTFEMGDFCKKTRNGGPYCSPEKDTKPLHEVELSSYSIGKFKVTHEDYDFYLKMAGLPKQYFEEKFEDEMLAAMTYFKNSPAVVTWTEADNYCSWLKKETGIPFSLPTEAQWEYAARGRGQYILVATDNGLWRVNERNGQSENFATDTDRIIIENHSGINSILVHFPVDKYPPTPFGLYGMADNGYEWVKDWDDPDYYGKSPKSDPQGPERPVVKDKKTGQYRKVLRREEAPGLGGDVGLTFFRGFRIKDNPYPAGTTVRCVVNSPEPIK